MGMRNWMLVHGKGDLKALLKSGPVLDRDATTALLKRLFPSERLQQLEDADLYSACPPKGEIVAGCFAGLRIVAAMEFALDRPSALRARFIEAFGDGQLVLHATHSVVDFCAFALWQDGALQRSLSVSPDSGIIEDIGPRLPFEAPYWEGEHPALDPEQEGNDYPLAFHPLELADAALLDFFGYQIEGDASQLDPEQIPLMLFRRKKSWWPFGQV